MQEENTKNPIRTNGSPSESTSNGTGKSDAALREEKVLEFWRENKIFQKSLEKKSPEGEYVFYDGPPTANGMPGIHHLIPQSFKDAIPRYKTMRGYHVRRKGGWDTHGLPVELLVEKELGLKSKKEIETYGIEKFNQKCKESVWKYVSVWYKYRDRVGYWVDKDNAYVTYHNDYIESLWNVVKNINDQKLLYKDYKVVPWCPRCGTALSSHELAQGYEEVKDLSVYVKFHLKAGQKWGNDYETKDSAYLLAWTTTPWTLPGNVGLAVGKDIKYTALRIKGIPELNIVATDRIESVFQDKEIEIVHEGIKGSDLVGVEYEPLYPFTGEMITGDEKVKMANAYKVYVAEFVNTTDGTGIVHTAVMYGQDDFELGTKVGLPKFHLVNPEGKFIKGTGFLEGRYVREVNADGKPTLAVDIIEDLKKRNLFFKQENYKHQYPHCWRCKTALIYYARDSWYIRMSDPKIKKELIGENKKINWEPEYIREGRFGEWLREIKDWAISRERYWGTPLPVWVCDKCDKRHVVGSLQDLKEKTKKSGNKYFVVRHGEAIYNAKHLNDPQGDPNNHLTSVGEGEVVTTAKKLKKEKIDFIITSPFIRTEETAEILRRELGLEKNQVIVDKRLHEENENNKSAVRERMGKFIYDIEQNHNNKNIVVVSHGSPIWILQSIASGASHLDFQEKEMLHTAEAEPLNFTPLPHNSDYVLDFHRPFIDEIKLVCDCGESMARTKEVMDVWFDSGAMPFAQDHYPFDTKKPLYPADFISEGIDQTRGWFYTLHAVGILMGKGRAYKNVICLGHLLDAKGKKMSKSIGNVVDPWTMMDKYGVDTLRMWMYSVNQPGESKNFDEKTIALLQQQVFSLLYNVLAFYELYRDKNLEKNDRPKSKNILDQWILARLDELVKISTENLDKYKLLEPARSIRDFVGDLSTWYLRRSRERIKEEDKNAKETLYFVLKTLAKIMAPLAPFAADDIWLKLQNESDENSVHLAQWPSQTKINSKILEYMQKVREIVSLGLEARQKAKIQVRQPLAKLEIKNSYLGEEYLELIKDELNVKEVKQNKNLEGDVVLDAEITEELKQEGNYRELVRALQDMRKKMGLTPSDVINICFETTDAGKKLVEKFEADMKKTVLVSKITFENNEGEEVKIDNLVFKVKIAKI